MKTSLDIFAATNPAYVASIITQFINGYTKRDASGCDYPLIFLPLPIVSSNMYSRTFNGTNTKTGLIEWLNRNAWISSELANSVQDTKEMSLAGLHLALGSGIIGLESGYKLLIGKRLKNRSAVIAENVQLRNSLQLAERLGSWLGQLKSAQIALHCLGLRI